MESKNITNSFLKNLNPPFHILDGRIFLRLGILFIGLLPTGINAQHIDSHSSLFYTQAEKSFHINYDNDVFTGTDYYYTQGFSFELIHPSLKKNPINKLLLQSKNDSPKQFGLTIRSASFTPKSIKSDTLLENDRPFAAATYLGFFKKSSFPKSKMLLSSELNVGMIGPAVFGKEVQSGIHKLTNNDQPKGWQFQMKNDLILNYTIQLEKQLIQYKSIVGVNSINRLNVGTFQTNLATGIQLFVGRKNNPFHQVRNKNFQIYIYSQSWVKVIGYDATLMGGVFRKNNAITYSYKEIESFTYEQHLGLAISSKRFLFAVNLGLSTREFKFGDQHSWGGFRIIFTK